MEINWEALALRRGQTVAQLQRTIHRQREHIRKLKRSLHRLLREDMGYARIQHDILIVQRQSEKLIAENERLRRRNGDLEALHSVVTEEKR